MWAIVHNPESLLWRVNDLILVKNLLQKLAHGKHSNITTNNDYYLVAVIIIVGCAWSWELLKFELSLA